MSEELCAPIDKYEALAVFLDRITELDDATCSRAMEAMKGKHGRDIINPLSRSIGLAPDLCTTAMEAWAELDATEKVRWLHD